MSTETRIVVIGLLFAVKFAAGYWLTRAGKPYSVIVLATHKLISLAIVAMIGITVHRLRRGIGLSSAEIVAVAITGLLFLLMIASGGLVSADQPAHAAIVTAHRVMPYLTVLSTAVTIYLVAS